MRSRNAALVTAALLLAAAGAPAAELAKDYPGPWRQESAAPIAATLAKNAVSGCGEFAYRQRAGGAPEYLVYCTRDGATWTAWLAWTATQKVLGPYPPEPGLAPPR